MYYNTVKTIYFGKDTLCNGTDTTFCTYKLVYYSDLERIQKQ